MDDLDNDENLERFRDLAEKIQVGDTEEGAQALGEIIREARGDRTSMREAVQQELAAKEIQAEIQAAAARFKKRYDHVNREPLLAEAAKAALREELYSDLKAMGLPEDQLEPIRNDIGRVASLHGAARLKGLKVRTPDELMDDTGRELSEKFGIRPSPSGRTREEAFRDMRAERGFRAESDGTGRSQEIAHEARTARSVPTYQAGPRRATVSQSEEE